MKKRIISILCCVVLLLVVVLVPAAPSARAVTGIDDALMFWFLATVVGAGAGLTLSYEGMNQQQASAAYASKFDEWQASSSGSGSTLSQWLTALGVSSDTVNISGSNNGLKVLLGTVIVQGLKDFWSWFNQSVLGSSSGTAADGVHAGSGGNLAVTRLSIPYENFCLPCSVVSEYGQNGDYVLNLSVSSGSSEVFLVPTNTDNSSTYGKVWFYSDSSFKVQAILTVGNSYVLTKTFTSSQYNNSFYYAGPGNWQYSHVVLDQFSGVLLDVSPTSYFSSLSSFGYGGVTVGYEDGLEAMTYPQDLEDENVESIPYVTSVPAEGVGEGDETGVIPLVDGIPAILDPALSDDLVVEYDDVKEPDTPADRPITSPGLADVFPFCLPFDIYHFFQALSANPVAPHFEWTMNIPGLVNYTFVIDLSQFNTVAQILRTLELLAFCVGLAFVTRAMLIRG